VLVPLVTRPCLAPVFSAGIDAWLMGPFSRGSYMFLQPIRIFECCPLMGMVICFGWRVPRQHVFSLLVMMALHLPMACGALLSSILATKEVVASMKLSFHACGDVAGDDNKTTERLIADPQGIVPLQGSQNAGSMLLPPFRKGCCWHSNKVFDNFWCIAIVPNCAEYCWGVERF